MQSMDPNSRCSSPGNRPPQSTKPTNTNRPELSPAMTPSGSTCITPGQRTPISDREPLHLPNSWNSPPLPTQEIFDINNNTPDSQPQPEPHQPSLTSLLMQLLPIIMKIFLSNSITDKIECFLEIGKILNASDLVEQTLNNLGTSSIILSQ